VRIYIVILSIDQGRGRAACSGKRGEGKKREKGEADCAIEKEDNNKALYGKQRKTAKS